MSILYLTEDVVKHYNYSNYQKIQCSSLGSSLRLQQGHPTIATTAIKFLNHPTKIARVTVRTRLSIGLITVWHRPYKLDFQ